MHFRHFLAVAACFSLGLVACGPRSTTFSTIKDNTDGPTLESELISYEVRFTNPICATYKYPAPIKSVGGKELTQAPQNAYCTIKDVARQFERPESPSHKLMEWIDEVPKGGDIFMTYFTFSNKQVAGFKKDDVTKQYVKTGHGLCGAVENRNVTMKFVMDKKQFEQGGDTATLLNSCKQAESGKSPEMVLRGGGTRGMEIAHNKLMLLSSPVAANIRVVFSSGNMSSGIATHHENWHFFEVPTKTYFAGVHACLRDILLTGGDLQPRGFSEAINACRGDLVKSGLVEESDMKSFFVPGEGQAIQKAADESFEIADLETDPSVTGYMRRGIVNATSIDMAAHRFSYFNMIEGIKDALRAGTLKKVRLVVDDDMYWVGRNEGFGNSNSRKEWQGVEELVKVGEGKVEVKYMQTSNVDKQLQHNKYMIFRDVNGKPFGIFSGAANLTGAAFCDHWTHEPDTKFKGEWSSCNLENFYYSKLPTALTGFDKQYEHVWSSLASGVEDMPGAFTVPKAAQ